MIASSRLSRVVFLLAVLFVTAASARPPAPPPPAGDVEERAKLIVEAVRKNDPKIANPFFFAADQFARVKAIKDPAKYFNFLLNVFHKDIEGIRSRLTAPDKAEFVSFSLGRGRNWIERGKEANKVPYYATYRSQLVIDDGGTHKTFLVRVMITWEGQWVCTHMLRKSLSEKLP